ncbi:hypothetical protein FQA39_LY11139 [Lamprigera yunnana]|nr:hypothetical protein FQA39_LY11139 [Lamprigera yunnana]
MPPKKNPPKTREEILEQKRIAERLRYHRLKNDLQKKEEMKEKERRKYKKKKEKGTRKLVEDMSIRQENTPDSEDPTEERPTPLRSSESALITARKKSAKKKREKILKEKDLKIQEYKQKMEKYKKSYQTFCRLRPFWVVTPKINERDTCLCIKHANINLKLTALHCRNILCYNNHNKLLENTCCNRYNEQCSRECQRCVNKNPDYKEFDDRKPITLKKWIAEKQHYKDRKLNKVRSIPKYVKRNLTKISRPCDNINPDFENTAGPSTISQQQYNSGDYVLVKFNVRKTEYRYVAIINQVDNEEGELTVTFMKICDNKGHKFRMDENDISDVSFNQIMDDVIKEVKEAIKEYRVGYENLAFTEISKSAYANEIAIYAKNEIYNKGDENTKIKIDDREIEQVESFKSGKK